MENKISDLLSNKKMFLKIAIISVIKAMRNDPEEYSALVYHNNSYNQNLLSSTTRSKDNNNNPNRQVMTLPPPPYDEYIIEHYKDIF